MGKLKKGIVIACVIVLGVVVLRCFLPGMNVNDSTAWLAAQLLVPSRLAADLASITSNPVYQGCRLDILVSHVKLADIQRQQFYANLETGMFQQYILSPEIDRLPIEEPNWRQTLWEELFRFIRQEKDPAAAAHIIVRHLRERVDIDPTCTSALGVETIWIQRMTDQVGFERIYVASLRAAGIAARLNGRKEAELWVGREWQRAPQAETFTHANSATESKHFF